MTLKWTQTLGGLPLGLTSRGTLDKLAKYLRIDPRVRPPGFSNPSLTSWIRLQSPLQQRHSCLPGQAHFAPGSPQTGGPDADNAGCEVCLSVAQWGVCVTGQHQE